jgi:hypothetical protein
VLTSVLSTRFESLEHCQGVLGFVNSSLRDETESEVKRGYSLFDDLARNGQEEPGVVVLHELVWPAETGGEVRRIGLFNVLGNSRARARLMLLGLNWEQALFGVRLATLRAVRPGAERAEELTADRRHLLLTDPGVAWNRLMAAYQTVSDALTSGEAIPEGYERLADESIIDLDAAARIAEAPCEVVIGVSHPERTLELVQELNLRDHLRGNLELGDEARALAMGDQVLHAYVNAEYVPAEHFTALSGKTVPDILAPARPRYEAEDVRRAQLERLLFPSDETARQLVSAALAEPRRKSDLRKAHITNRSRVYTALVSRGNVNPRIGDVFLKEEVTSGRVGDGQTLGELLAAATNDPTGVAIQRALDAQAVIMLGEHKLYEAARGSNVNRREPGNVRQALRRDPVRGLGLVKELHSARAEERRPRTVDAQGVPVEETTATEKWFDEAFPKNGGTTTKAAASAQTKPAPPETPEQQMHTEQAAVAGVVEKLDEATSTLRDTVTVLVELCQAHNLRLDTGWVEELNRRITANRNALRGDCFDALQEVAQ